MPKLLSDSPCVFFLRMTSPKKRLVITGCLFVVIGVGCWFGMLKEVIHSSIENYQAQESLSEELNVATNALQRVRISGDEDYRAEPESSLCLFDVLSRSNLTFIQSALVSGRNSKEDLSLLAFRGQFADIVSFFEYIAKPHVPIIIDTVECSRLENAIEVVMKYKLMSQEVPL